MGIDHSNSPLVIKGQITRLESEAEGSQGLICIYNGVPVVILAKCHGRSITEEGHVAGLL